jgi:predicted nucleotidyltransferase
MDTATIIAKLRENKAALRARGVRHAALFGSHARGEGRPGSDIDIFVEIEPSFPMDVFQYIGVVHAIEDMFAERVDVSNRAAMKPDVRRTAERDAIYASDPARAVVCAIRDNIGLEAET